MDTLITGEQLPHSCGATGGHWRGGWVGSRIGEGYDWKHCFTLTIRSGRPNCKISIVSRSHGDMYSEERTQNQRDAQSE